MNNEIIDCLRTLSYSFQMHMKEQIAKSNFGLSAFQARLINLIGRNDGISQLTLSMLTERDKAQIARTIKELEAKDLVTHSVNASDKRAKCLSLTLEGREMHRQLNTIREQLSVDTLSSLSDEEKQVLHTILQKVTAHSSPKG